MRFLVWIIVGVIAGWLTGLIVKRRGFGLIGDLIMGLLGGLIGGWLFRLVGWTANTWLGEIVVAVIGGVILVTIVRLLRRV
jgi:uncharacterized membrane protein YeaQ/YmgE (transglycosylase-associated protein family)